MAVPSCPRHKAAAPPPLGSAWYPGGGPQGFGGDAFWSWGSLGGVAGTITPHAAENLASVLAAVNAISATIGSMPAYITKADDTRATVDDHPLARLIEGGVNENETWSDLIEGMLASCLLRGNALAEIETDARGRLTGLCTVPWQQITPLVDESGALLFDYVPTVPPNAGQRRRFMRADVVFLKDRGDAGLIGVSRLTRAGGALQIALELQSASSQFLTNAARPSGTLSPAVNWGDDQRRKLREEWDLMHSSKGRGRVALLPGAAVYTPLGLMSAEDQQLVAHRNFSVADVARIFQVPPFMLADPSRSTFASSKEAGRQFAQQSLMPWTKRLERCFAQSVLSSQYRLVIDLNDLLRADPEARWASWQRARAAGVLSPNDARREEGWPASSDPTADSIEPPAAGGKPADQPSADEPPPAPAPPPEPDDNAPDDQSKIARLDQRRGHHASD